HAQFFSYSLLFFSYFTRSLAFLSTFIFFLQCPAHPRDLPSFPTRRSSDLSLSLRVNKASRAAGSNPAPGGRSRRPRRGRRPPRPNRKSTRLNSSHVKISYAVFCLKKKKQKKKKNKTSKQKTQEKKHYDRPR